MTLCPHCGRDFHHLGIASHRAACRRKKLARLTKERPPGMHTFVPRQGAGADTGPRGARCARCGLREDDGNHVRP